MAVIDWYKVTLDYLKTNKWVIIAVLGLGGNGVQGFMNYTPVKTDAKCHCNVAGQISRHVEKLH